MAQKSTTKSRSEAKTLKRFAKQNRSWGKSGRLKHYIDVPEGKLVLDQFLDQVADYLAKSAPPPANLAEAIAKLDRHTLALAALTSLFDAERRGWGDVDEPAWKLKLYLQIGEHLRDRLMLAGALESDNAAERLIGKTIMADPESGKGRRFRGKLKRMLESDNPDERAAAQRVAAMPPRRGRPRQSDYLDLLKPEWNQEETLQAGGWLAHAVLTGLDLFLIDRADRIPYLNPKFEPIIDDLREQLLWRDPVLMPHMDGPPPDWTSWRTNYGGRLSKTLVKDWRPETKVEIEAALAEIRTGSTTTEEEADLMAKVVVGEADPGELQTYVESADHISVPITVSGPFKAQHVAAMDTLKNVPLRLDPVMVELVKEFGARTKSPNSYDDLINSNDKVDRAIGYKLRRQNKRDITAVKREMADAKWLIKQNGPFRLSYSLDRRGRFYAHQHLNFAREDHIRALFQFDRGMPMDEDGIVWLEVHAANMWGLDKRPWAERVKWTREHKEDIRWVEADPGRAIIHWRTTGDPDKKPEETFMYIAACRELVAAWDNPGNFTTHLPISFDGSCNGIQHLAMIMSDPVAAKLVNLIASHAPQDVYKKIVDCVLLRLKTARGRHAMWWQATFARLDDKTKRKLIKTPAMAFAYNISSVGMADDIRKVFQEEVSRKREAQPPKVKDGTPKTGEMYLAQLIRGACEEVLKLPADGMKYMQDVAKHCSKEGRFVRVVGPTGMPFVGRYHIANEKEVQLASGSRHKLKDGATEKINKPKIVDSIAANLVHMMDAAHLGRVINAAAAEPDHPIEVLTVHDSYSCLAPHARRLNQIIRNEMVLMYSAYDLLAELRILNVTGDILPLPPRGNFDRCVVIDSPDSF
jgi:hypothetical protein